MALIDGLHEKMIFGRRVDVLSSAIANLLPPGASVLDIGCGSGLVAKRIQEHREDVSIRGVDVLVRPQTYIPVKKFDGKRLPFDDASFDVTLFVDVLHHTEDPLGLMREAFQEHACC